ncbi:alpha/beta hydrolase fold domain-containing protein [Pannonibacter sp. Pt2-lr]
MELPPHVVRARREQGIGPFPAPVRIERARDIWIGGAARGGTEGNLRLRLFLPQTGQPEGAFLHIHGGGWTFGGADMQDLRLAEMADRTGLLVASVDYRLAPSTPILQRRMTAKPQRSGSSGRQRRNSG